ncbi:MAG: hypothetical protein Q8K75_10205 [Chlamydiales bacterium]|nr:hypothetical protein [Chlamydiales bacterium]
MKRVIIGAVSLSFLVAAFAFCVEPPAQEGEYQAKPYPIEFDSSSHHISAIFPVPSHKIQQDDQQLYLAQGTSRKDSKGRPLVETFSLMMQKELTFMNVTSETQAQEVGEKFLERLKGQPEVTFNQLSVNHKPESITKNEASMLIEVIDHARTDYYAVRFIVLNDGVLIGIHTLQKGEDKAPDFSSEELWGFIDSIKVESKGAVKS